MFHSLVNAISGSSWSYAIIFAVAMLDAFFPLVPSESTVIAAGVLAASGDLELLPTIASASAGAVVGDNISYHGGRFFGERLLDRVFRGKRRRHLERAERALDNRGGYLIVVGRFIPGGRTAVTFAAGSLEWPWRRFIGFACLAGVLWGGYAALLGYFGGSAFEDEPLKGFLLAFGVALAVTATVELVRRRRRRQPAAAADADLSAGQQPAD
jgi:membrane protein DedA with SNARE-associated domain